MQDVRRANLTEKREDMMIKSATAIGAVLSLLGAPTAAPTFATAPPSGRVSVEVISIAGSGCPFGTVSTEMTPDNGRFQLQESSYQALVGVGARSTDARKSCQLAIQIAAPPGYTYAISGARRFGYAYLADGATGRERDRYYLQGEQPPTYDIHSFVGPMDDTWSWQTDVVDETALVWAPCDERRPLTVDSELRVWPGTSDVTKTTSLLSKDSLDEGAYGTLYSLAWKRC